MSHRAAKAQRRAAKATAQSNLRRLYALCLARCAGNLAATATLYQATSAQFPRMTLPTQAAVLAGMEADLARLQLPVPQ